MTINLQLSMQDAGSCYHETSPDTQAYLAALWKEIIGLEQVALSDKFLDVGGNSLTLNVILGRIEAELNVSPDPASFFHSDTSSLSALAMQLHTLLECSRADSRCPPSGCASSADQATN